MLSIIICTYNRDVYLYKVLKHIAENDLIYSEYEIVLINNNSTDNTEKEYNRFRLDYPEVNTTYFIEKQQGLSFARNRGIKEARGEVLVFLDDDAFVCRDYLSKLILYLIDYPSTEAFGGKIIPVFESGKEPLWFSRWSYSFVSALDMGDKVKEFNGNSFPTGANMGFYKVCVEKAGYFNTALGRNKRNLIAGEEKDLFVRFKKNNYKIYYFPGLLVQHVIPESRTTYEYIKKLGKGIGISEYIRCKKEGKGKLLGRYFSECAKWAASLLLWCYYAVQGKFPKGYVLLLFRWNVSKGLFVIKM